MVLTVINLTKIYFVAMTTSPRSYLDGVAIAEGVQLEGSSEVVRGELSPDVVLRETVVDTQILDPRCKAFVEPQMGPPFLYGSTSHIYGDHRPMQVAHNRGASIKV